jgi:flavin reductase (DIM6/NTAB) family NADH-FMN oxidoreductase RutF/rubredoxin
MNFEAFYRITYGLYIVSSKNGSKLNGYISNTVFQVSAEPAQFAIACSKNNFTAGMIDQSKVFAISVLKKEVKTEIIGIFGYQTGQDIDKFAHAKYKVGKTGAPIVTEDTIAWFECEVVQTINAGSHIIFIGKVVDGDLLGSSGEPLTYAYYREVKKGKAPKNAPTYISAEKLKDALKQTKEDIYYCPACGYIYDPETGDPSAGVPAGTSFKDLPGTWVCPICGTEKADFVKRV